MVVSTQLPWRLRYKVYRFWYIFQIQTIMDFLVQRAKDKHHRSVLCMLSDVLGTHTGKSSICLQWCTTWLVLLSFIFLVENAKINISKVYYLYLGMYEVHRLVYFLFLTSGAPLDCSYSPFSCLLLVQRAKTIIPEVYYICPVIYELHGMLTIYISLGIYIIHFWFNCFGPLYKE